MPGIVGLITRKPREWAEEQRSRMLASMRHESFYQSGSWTDESLGIYVGWVKREHSFCNRMPLRDESGNLALVFSGEEFPAPDTMSRLKEQGHTFDDDGCSYLVHLAERDPAFPVTLNGQFHGILVDRSQGTVKLFNDRYGMHRIYFHQAQDAFYFSAEAKAILNVWPELRSPAPQALGEFVACGCVLENRTLFKGIEALPPASAWTFRNGALDRKANYFSPQEWENQPVMDPEPFYQEIRATFERNLSRYFSGPERIGLSLTGGLDTRMILAWQKPAPGSLPCYTFGGSYRECRDVEVARKVARACGQSYEVIPVGADFLSRFAHYAERTLFLTDGCSDASRAPDLYVNEIARQIAPIRMTGNYGDQVMRHMRVFRPSMPAPDLFRPEFLSEVEAACATYNRITQVHALTFAAFQQAPWHHYGLLALELSQLSMRTPYLDNDLVRVLFRAPASTLGNNDLRVRLIGDGSTSLRNMRTDLGFAGNGSRLTAKVSQRFHRFTMSAEYAYDYGMPQWLARIDHAFSPLRLERLFLGRHKFTHFRIWFREALAGYVQQMLLDPRALARPYLNATAVEVIVDRHLKGIGNHTTEIHNLLTLELMHRLFFDAQ